MNLKKILSILLLFVIIMLQACNPDLGDFEDDNDYVNSFDISWIDENNNHITTYSLEDFYFPDLTKKMTSPMEKPTKMKYLYIKAKHDLNIEDMAFYLKSPTGGAIGINAYVASSLPNKSNFRNLDDELVKIKNGQIIDPSSYSDPKEGMVTGVRYTLSKDKWDSRLFRIYKTLKSGDYLIFQFIENTDAFYEPADDTVEAMEELILERNEKRVDVFLTGIFIRAVNK